MNERSMAKADFITSVVLVGFGIFVVVTSLGMPTYAERGRNPFSAPGIVPGLLGSILFFLGAVMLIRSIKKRGHQLDLSAAGLTSFFLSGPALRVTITVLISVAYATGLTGRLPYPLATFVYITVFILLFEYDLKRGPKTQLKTILFAALVGLLTAAVVSLVFQYVFLVSLP